MTEDKIESSTLIAHASIKDAFERFLEEAGLTEPPPPAKEILSAAFAEGWGTCLQETLEPAMQLAMVLLQIMSLQEKASEQSDKGFQVVLSGEALESMRELCTKITGMPEQWQLDQIVEPVMMDKPPEQDSDA